MPVFRKSSFTGQVRGDDALCSRLSEVKVPVRPLGRGQEDGGGELRGAPYRAADCDRRADRAGALAVSRARRWNICLRPTPWLPRTTSESQGAPWAAFWTSLNFRARATGEIWPDDKSARFA